jgi:hypothetical protein
MSAAFVPLLLVEVLSVSGVPGTLPPVLGLLPAVATALLLALGTMVVNPFALEMVPRLGKDRLTAVYFGTYSMGAGIGAMIGNTVTGLAFDAQDTIGLPGLPWTILIGLGLVCSISVRLLSRRRELQDAGQPTPTVA